ncbi:MAG: hypothetical protein Q7W51_07750 [Coriobacteriia bacterium]|nr:hypothetical protein [Coriobacteriia bacterium]
MGVQWIDHAGKRILYVDYSQCKTEEEMLAIYEMQAQQMRLQPRTSLVLSSFGGASIGSAYMKRVSEGGRTQGDLLLDKAAFLGVDGLKGILFDGYVRVTGLGDKVKTFDNEADALAWLTND